MKRKNIVLIVLALLIVGIAVAYAAFSQKLTINGTANIDSAWNVKITDITLDSSSVGATEESTASYTDTSATFNVKLGKPGDKAVYKVTVANAGTVDAKLNSVTDLTSINNADPTALTYTIDAVANDELAKRTNESTPTTKVYTVTVEWAAASTAVPETKTKTATIELNYVQK